MQMKKWGIKVAILFLSLGVASACPAKVIHVDADAAGANDGSSWADAYNDLQDALSDAYSMAKPLEIRVAQGIYRPARDPDHEVRSFRLQNSVVIRGGYAGFGEAEPDARDVDRYETILSGDVLGNDADVNDPCDLLHEPSRADNSYHVVSAKEVNETAVLDGFTITGGRADDYYGDGGGMHLTGTFDNDASATVINCTFKGNCARDSGGGIYCLHAIAHLTDCTFTGNSALYGGGIDIWEMSILTRCSFHGNSAKKYGGGMIHAGAPVLTDCSFSRNTANQMGGAVCGFDAFRDPTMVNCIFEENSAPRGGAIGNSEAGAILYNCIFIGNSAEEGGGLLNSGGSGSHLVGCAFIRNSAFEVGGAISNDRGVVSLRNCSLSGNSAGIYGGGVFDMSDNYWVGLSLENCSFAGNMAEMGNALACDHYYWGAPGIVQLTNCILWDGGIEVWNNEDISVMIGYNDVKGGQASIQDPCNAVVWGQGNIDADPCFADTGYWDPNGTPEDANDDFWVDSDYHLRSQAGRWDASEGRWMTDDVTSPCIDAGDPMSPIGNEPFPNGGIINMGAYGGTAEASKSYFGGPVCQIIVAGDINGDCEVNFLDFRLVALHWLEEH